jgi:hypothetical protein
VIFWPSFFKVTTGLLQLGDGVAADKDGVNDDEFPFLALLAGVIPRL